METRNQKRYSKKEDHDLRMIKALPGRKERLAAFSEYAAQTGRSLHAVRQRAVKLRSYKKRNGNGNGEPAQIMPVSTGAMPENVLHGTIAVTVKGLRIEGDKLFISF